MTGWYVVGFRTLCCVYLSAYSLGIGFHGWRGPTDNGCVPPSHNLNNSNLREVFRVEATGKEDKENKENHDVCA